MRISHNKKFIYISIPRTGSQSLRNSLAPFCENKINHHAKNSFQYTHSTAKQIKHYFKINGWKWKEYFKFTFVRNPWERIYSRHKYNMHIAKIWGTHLKDPDYKFEGEDEQRINYLIEKSKNGHEIPEYLVAQKYPTLDDALLRSAHLRSELQTKFIYNSFGINMLDFVGKLENIKEDSKIIFTKLNIEPKDYKLNSLNSTDYKSHYSAKSKDLIYKLEKKIIKKYSYEF